MSHRLRTPLNAEIGYAEMLGQDAEDDALDARAAADDLARTEAGGRQLLRLVSRVLDLSSLESGQFETNVSRFPLTPFIHEVAARIRPAAERAGLTLTLDAPDGPVEVVADRERVALILANLRTNALQFTPAGQITLSESLTPDALAFAVIDTGVGIAPEHHARIFDVFTELDASFTRRVDGAGLGLALCARFAERLGGRLAVESALGRGATFTLTLPRFVDET